VKASCDALDGVADGLIQNPAQCSFVPSSLVRGGVLTASQAAALQSYITRETDPSGAPVNPGMPISDLSTAGFEGFVELSTPAPDPTAAEPWGAKGVGPGAWRSVDATIRALVEENQSFDVNNDWPVTVSATRNVIPDATLALLSQRTGAGDSDDPFKLANFLNKGGKVIMYHGGSDPLDSSFQSIWFYEELASLHGGYRHTQDSARLFIVPGMGHCGRTMPLCKFPEEARYSGSGDVNLAVNWTCNPDDQRMLLVGRDGVAAGADPATALEFLYEAIGLNGQ